VAGSIAVGTSGWSYDHWDGLFYPRGVTHANRLAYYVTRFPAVEVNYSFYRLPSERTIRSWHDVAPRRFRYAVKASRYITHVLRLVDAEEAVGTFVSRVSGLRTHLGVVLWQLPPDFEADLDVLDAFLAILPRRVRHAVEFRHGSWVSEETFELLEREGAALVCVSSEAMPAVRRATADFVYARFHGRDTGYDYDYTQADLEPWAAFLQEQSRQGRDGYAFFNNDAHGNAPHDAKTLIRLLGEAAVPW